MIRVDEFTYLYHLKESKEYGYYELVPWVKEAWIVKGLPLVIPIMEVSVLFCLWG